MLYGNFLNKLLFVTTAVYVHLSKDAIQYDRMGQTKIILPEFKTVKKQDDGVCDLPEGRLLSD